MDEFARERRIFTPVDEIPDLVKQAFISAEDKNFYEHHGFDPRGIVAAVYDSALHGSRLRGASTITQQVMKNFLLTGDRSGERKIKEIILATRLENTLTKDEILQLYLNEIFLGQNSYGVTAAAQIYFGKSLDELTVSEAAYLAALPQGAEQPPSGAAEDRRHRPPQLRDRQMADNGYLTRDAAAAAQAEDLLTVQGGELTSAWAGRPPRDYFTDEIRRQLSAKLGDEELFTGGLAIRATVDPEAPGRPRPRRCATGSRSTTAASRSIAGRWPRSTPRASTPPTRRAGARRSAPPQVPRDIAGWHPAVILSRRRELGPHRRRGRARGRRRRHPRLRRRELGAGARRQQPPARRRAGPADLWKVGDVIFVKAVEKDGAFDHWSYRQIPAIQGGFMAMDTQTGRVLAMQGGFSYQSSVFNRATQALRQPGSSFKPFVYAAALDSGYSPATIVLDAPIEVATGAGIWKPENSGNTYYGPTPMRTGIEQSRNLMTVRIAQDIGMDLVAKYGERFGIYDNMPRAPQLLARRRRDDALQDGRGLCRARQRRPQGRADPRRPRAGPLRQDHLPPRPARLRGLHRRRRDRRREPDGPFQRRAGDGRDHRLPGHLDAAGRGRPRHQRRHRSASSTSTSPARPAPPTRPRTSGTSATRRASSPAATWATTIRAPRRERLRRHALRADLRRVHQGGDEGAGAGQAGRFPRAATSSRSTATPASASPTTPRAPTSRPSTSATART